MRIAKILMIVGIAVVLLVVGAIVVLMSMDFNQYKPEIAAEVKKATGRDFDIEGDLRLNLLSFSPGLEVDGVKFANAPWGSRPEMATIKRFEVKVSLLPLLSGALSVDSVVIDGADILVERNREGQGNYQFLAADTQQKDGAAKPAADSQGETSGGGFPELAIEEIIIENSKVTYRDDATGQTLALGIDRLSVEPESGDRLDLEIKGAYNDAAFTITGKTGRISQLLGSSDPWPLSLKAALGGATVDVDGRIADPKAVSGIDITLSVAGDDLSKMSAFAGGPVPSLGPYSLNAKIAGSLDKSIDINDLAAKVGGSDLSGKVSASLKGKPRIQATLASTLINLDDFTKGAAGGGSSSTGGGQGSAGGSGGAAAGGSDGRIFPNDPLPVDGLKAADADIKLSVTKLVVDKIAVGNLETTVALRNGDLAVAPLSADVGKGRINGTVNLRASQATPAVALKVEGQKINVGDLLAEMEITDLLYGVVNADIDIRGSGDSVRQIMAGLNGKTSIVMGQGRLKSTAIETYVGGAAAVLTQLFAGKKSEYTVVNCFVNQFDIKGGIAESKVMLFDTELAQITGSGDINFATERIDYKLDPRPKSATFNTAVPVTIGGTLADPTYGLDPIATAARVGGLIGSVFFPPAAILALGDLGVGDDNPCVKQASGKGETAPKAEESGPAGIIKGLEEKLDSGVKDKLDKGLKKLFGN